MNYIFLKQIISAICTSFLCPECKNQAHEENIDIQSISDKGVEFLYLCPKCKAKTLMKAEMNQITNEFLSSDAGKSFLKKMISERKIVFPQQKKSVDGAISGEEIATVEETLSKNPTINNLINGE